MIQDFSLELKLYTLNNRHRVCIVTPHAVRANLYLPYANHPPSYTLHAAPHWAEGSVLDGVFEGEDMVGLLEHYFETRGAHALDAAYLACGWNDIVQDVFRASIEQFARNGAAGLPEFLLQEQARMNALALTKHG